MPGLILRQVLKNISNSNYVIGLSYFKVPFLWEKQDALDLYLKLPQKHYNTGWVLSQVDFSVLFSCLLLCASHMKLAS